jgi:4a-hydroxytetrahydrobiopterin dehydratase
MSNLSLSEQKCEACEGGVAPLELAVAQKYSAQLSGWVLEKDARVILKKYTFKSYYPTMSFINAVAYIAQQEGHHPDIEFGYNYCNIRYTTHAINGLSINDFICAAKIDKLIRVTKNS